MSDNDKIKIAIIGNPNCGKTTVYNALTGARGRVGNWPGVTVERKTSVFSHDSKTVEITDLPGVYGLCTSCDEDEAIDARIARDYISGGNGRGNIDVIVDVVDSCSLERNLYLTTQLIEMGMPLVIALNMTDCAKRMGTEIDANALSQKIGCRVVPIVGTKGKGIYDLKDAIIGAAQDAKPPKPQYYRPQMEDAISRINKPTRWGSLQALECGCDEASKAIRCGMEAQLLEDIDTIIADDRYTLAHNLAIGVQKQENVDTSKSSWTQRIDGIALNRWAGIPIFLGVMYLLFFLTITVAGAFIDFFDILAGSIFVDGSRVALEAAHFPQWLIAIISDGVGGGAQTVATFIPIVGFLFVFLTFLEDSGYMSRASFIADRAMRAVGLPGQAFVPMILGFGCTVPAVMAVRSLENPRARIATAMMTPFMSCGARLPVYALFAAAFFPTGGQNVVFMLYAFGIMFGVITGFILNKTMLRGEAPSLVMELPSYHWPTLRAVLSRTWHRLREFIFRAGKVIITVVVILSALGSLGTDGSFGNENNDKSVLAAVGKGITPVLEPMGLSEENWPASVALFTGLFAKEVVVGTLNTLYMVQSGGGDGAAAQDDDFNLLASVKSALASVPEGISGAVLNIKDPIGVGGALEDGKSATFGAMVTHFDGKAGALAYLMMILLYMPCVAATAAILRETSAKWAIFMALWSTGLGWGVAVITYQVGTFLRHPQESLLWVCAVLAVFFAAVCAMRFMTGGVKKTAKGELK